jgi:hypothetical protein
LNASADGLLRENLEAVAQAAVNEALESLPEVVARRVKGRRYLVSVSEVDDPDRDRVSGGGSRGPSGRMSRSPSSRAD